MTKTLFIDFDGTLCHDRFWRSLNTDLVEKVQQYLFKDEKTVVDDWMKGIYTSEGVNKKLADTLGVEYNFLWDIFVEDCKSMKVDEKVLEQLKKLRNSFKLILITDNMDCFDRFTVPALKLDDYFDAIVNSFNERVSKNENEGQLFKEVMKRVDVDPKDTILIDNSNKSCTIFEKLGGMSFLVTNEKPLAFWLKNLNK